jgi:hypothetical protein
MKQLAKFPVLVNTPNAPKTNTPSTSTEKIVAEEHYWEEFYKGM